MSKAVRTPDGTRCYTGPTCRMHAGAIREAELVAKQAKNRTREENEFIARRQWHPTRNLLAYDEVRSGDLTAWWQCSIAADHEWQAPKNKRTSRGDGCPFCSGHRASSTNNLTLRPDLAAELDEEAAGVKAAEVTLASNQMLPWRCANGHSWLATPKTRQVSGCATCQLRHFGRYPSFEASVAGRYPQLVPLFDEERNGMTAAEANGALDKTYWWTCSIGHSQQRTVGNRAAPNSICTRCNGRSISFESSLAGRFPEISATLNENLSQISAVKVHPGSSKRLMWNCTTGDPEHIYDASPRERTGLTSSGKPTGCPFCSNHRLSKSNNLAAVAPGIAPEFDEEKNGCKAEDVIAGSNTPMWWKCTAGKGHRGWRTSPNLRTGKGKTGCPRCSPWSTSKPESLFRAAFSQSTIFKAVAQDNNATVPILMKNNRNMKVDVLATLKDGNQVVVEYDGAYYHKSDESIKRDVWKTVQLLEAGYAVVRIRENELVHLGLKHPNFFQLNHSAKRSHAALGKSVLEIEGWLADLVR